MNLLFKQLNTESWELQVSLAVKKGIPNSNYPKFKLAYFLIHLGHEQPAMIMVSKSDVIPQLNL